MTDYFSFLPDAVKRILAHPVMLLPLAIGLGLFIILAILVILEIVVLSKSYADWHEPGTCV